MPAPVIQALTVLFLVSVFAQALLTLVGSNFVTFAFFSARHTIRVMSEKLLLIGRKFWVGHFVIQLKDSKPKFIYHIVPQILLLCPNYRYRHRL